MLMSSKFKLLLSKIVLAQQSQKFFLNLKISYVDLTFLNVLWKNGIIYGYNKINNNYNIILKYNSLSSGGFIHNKLTKKKLKTLITLNPNDSYIFITCKGVFIFSKKSLIMDGGILISKI
jgi:ribosomal protein S8